MLRVRFESVSLAGHAAKLGFVLKRQVGGTMVSEEIHAGNKDSRGERIRRAAPRVLIALLLIFGAYELARMFLSRETQTKQTQNAVSIKAVTVGKGDIRSHRQRSWHGVAARDRQCRHANQRPVDASRLSRRPDGQEGRFSGANRSAPLRDFTGAIRRPAHPRPRTARPGENRSGPLPNAVAAKFDRATDRGGSGLSRQAVPRDR